jgi:hypothetical protein
MSGIAKRDGIQTPPNGRFLLLAGSGIALTGCGAKSLKTLLKMPDQEPDFANSIYVSLSAVTI